MMSWFRGGTLLRHDNRSCLLVRGGSILLTFGLRLVFEVATSSSSSSGGLDEVMMRGGEDLR